MVNKGDMITWKTLFSLYKQLVEEELDYSMNVHQVCHLSNS